MQIINGIFTFTLSQGLQTCFFIAAILILRIIFKKIPRRYFCILWTIAFIRLVLPFSLSLPISLIPAIDIESYLTETYVSSAPLTQTYAGSIPETLQAAFSSPSSDVFSQTTINTVLSLAALTSALVITIVLIRNLHLTVRLFRLTRTSTPYDNLSGVRQVDFFRTSFVLGFIHPVIYLPYGLEADDTANILAHERAHIMRLDHIVKPLVYLITVLFWFHPAVLLAYRAFMSDMEAACDELAIRTLGKEKTADYINTLTYIGTGKRLLFPSFNSTDTGSRISRILNGVNNSGKALLLFLVISIIATATLATTKRLSTFHSLPRGAYQSERCLFRSPMLTLSDRAAADNSSIDCLLADNLTLTDLSFDVSKAYSVEYSSESWQQFPFSDREWDYSFYTTLSSVPSEILSFSAAGNKNKSVCLPISSTDFLVLRKDTLYFVKLMEQPYTDELPICVHSIYQLSPK